MGRIVFLGDANLDLVLRVSGLPPGGGEAEAAGGGIRIGGCAVNAACWAAWLGEEAVLWARIGGDLPGDRLVGELRSRGLDPRYLQRDPALPTGLVVVLVDPEGERTMISLPGANRALEVEGIEGIGASLLYVSGYALLRNRAPVLKAMASSRARGVIVVLDPGPLLPEDALAEAIPAVDVVLGGIRELGGGPERLLELGVLEVVVKLGAGGCGYFSPGKGFRIPAYPLGEAEDTTGAGDAFGAGYVCGFLGGLSPEARCLLGGLLGALAATGAFPPAVPQEKAEELIGRLMRFRPDLSPHLEEVRGFLRRRDPWKSGGSSG